MGRISVFPVFAVVAMAVAAVGARPGMGAAGEGKKSPAAPTKESVEGTSYTETVEGLNLEMVWIPGGTFQMGSRLSPEEVVKKYGGKAGDEKVFTDEHPVHEVVLDGFWMGKFEVTNAQYRKFKPSNDSGEFFGLSLNGEQQPAVRVSWDDAKAFCDWLSKESGKSYTLPTEAQWEYACRARTEAERYWGDDDARMGEYANTCDRTLKGQLGAKLPSDWIYAETTDGYAVSAPVGRLKPNAFGLYDMIGNVGEWCADWYGPYSGTNAKNPVGPANGQFRVLRGSYWGDGPWDCRSALRLKGTPGFRVYGIGFRLLRTQK